MAGAPELLPFGERVLLRSLLIPFTALVAYMFAWGLCSAVVKFVEAVFGEVESKIGWIPFVGRVVSRPVHSIQHKITSIVGGWALNFEHQFFTRWHQLGQTVRQLAADVEAAALLDFHLAQRLSHFLVSAQIHLLLKAIHKAEQVLGHRTVVVEGKVVHVTKIVGTKANSAVAHRVGALAGELEHVIEWDIPRLRGRERALADQVGRLWRRVRADARGVGALAFAGAVAIALGRLGAGWVRCNNWKRAGRTVCGMDASLLSSLLADTILIAGSLSLVEFATELQPITNESARLIQNFWRVG